jgi:hypothetical protein
MELALAGLSYDDIAEQVGYTNRGTAWRAVQHALRERTLQAVDEHREMELARLDALQAAHWEAAVSGSDLKAAELCLKVSAQRIKLLGLEASPGANDQSGKTVVITGTSEEYIAGMKALCEADESVGGDLGN